MSIENEGIADATKKELEQLKLSLKMLAGGIFAYAIATSLSAALSGVKGISFIFLGIKMFSVIGILTGGVTGILSGAEYFTSTRNDKNGTIAIIIGFALTLAMPLLLMGKDIDISVDAFTSQSYGLLAMLGFVSVGFISSSLAKAGIVSRTKSYLIASMGLLCLMIVGYPRANGTTEPFFYSYLILVSSSYIGIYVGNKQRSKWR